MKNLFFLLFTIYLLSCDNDNVVVRSRWIAGNNDSLCLTTKNWGLTSDKQLTIISKTCYNDHSLKYDTSSSYVFDGLSPFLYQINFDTIIVYISHVNFSHTPSRFISKMKLVQVKMNNDELIRMWEEDSVKYKMP
jgi:Zn ribbon nucleic-acid-binding protein